MKQRATSVAAALALPALPDLRAAGPEWPGWRGPDARRRVAGDRARCRSGRPSGPPLAWKASGLGAGFSSLAVVGRTHLHDGRSRTARSTCSRSAPTDGAPLWKTRVGPAWNDEYGGPRGTPTVDGGLRLRRRHRGRPGRASRPRPARSAGAEACRATSAAG